MKSSLWPPLMITLTSLFYGIFLVTLALIEFFSPKNLLFAISTLCFGIISILSSIGGQIGLFTKDYLTIVSSITLMTVQNIFIFILSTISLFDVIKDYHIFTKHRANKLLTALEYYRWLGILVLAAISFISLACILFMWTFYEPTVDDTATLLGHPFNMTSDFWHYPTARTMTSKIFTPRKLIYQSSTANTAEKAVENREKSDQLEVV